MGVYSSVLPLYTTFSFETVQADGVYMDSVQAKVCRDGFCKIIDVAAHDDTFGGKYWFDQVGNRPNADCGGITCGLDSETETYCYDEGSIVFDRSFDTAKINVAPHQQCDADAYDHCQPACRIKAKCEVIKDTLTVLVLAVMFPCPKTNSTIPIWPLHSNSSMPVVSCLTSNHKVSITGLIRTTMWAASSTGADGRTCPARDNMPSCASMTFDKSGLTRQQTFSLILSVSESQHWIATSGNNNFYYLSIKSYYAIAYQ